jgi:hypothetical protein
VDFNNLRASFECPGFSGRFRDRAVTSSIPSRAKDDPIRASTSYIGLRASGSIACPGFDRLVATVCAGELGAVLCLDAARLARNGRDWHHLLELCGLVGARVIDTDAKRSAYLQLPVRS